MVKSFWPVQNKQRNIDVIKKLSIRNKSPWIATYYDLSTLYTNIPHNELRSLMRQLINLRFKDCGYTVHYCNKIWCNMDWWKKNKFKTVFVAAFLELAINILPDNCFFNFGNLSYRQIIGIRMGSDLALFMANFFLYYYKNKLLLDTEKILKRKIYEKHTFLAICFVLETISVLYTII